MYELFAKRSSLTSPENAHDYLVLDGKSPKVQIITADEIEHSGASSSLSARGATIVSSADEDQTASTFRFLPEADVVVLSWPSTDLPSAQDTSALNDALESANGQRLIVLCPTVVCDAFRSSLSEHQVPSLIVARESHSITATLVRSLRKILIGEFDPPYTQEPVVSHSQIHLSAQLIEILNQRESQILELISDGLSNGKIAEQLGIRIRTVNNYIGAVFRKLGLTGTDDLNSRVIASLAYSVRLRSMAGLPAAQPQS